MPGKSTDADDSEAQSTVGAEDSKIEKKAQETTDSTKAPHAEDESTADGKQPATLEDANQLVLFIFYYYLCSVVIHLCALADEVLGIFKY